MPWVFTNQETWHIRVASAMNVWIVGNRHVPLVQSLVIFDDCVLFPDVTEQTSFFLICHHKWGVKSSSVAQASQSKEKGFLYPCKSWENILNKCGPITEPWGTPDLAYIPELYVLRDSIRESACWTGGSVPTINTLPKVAVIVNPTLVCLVT